MIACRVEGPAAGLAGNFTDAKRRPAISHVKKLRAGEGAGARGSTTATGTENAPATGFRCRGVLDSQSGRPDLNRGPPAPEALAPGIRSRQPAGTSRSYAVLPYSRNRLNGKATEPIRYKTRYNPISHPRLCADISRETN